MVHTEQMHQMLEVKENENQANNGMYMVFYMLHEDLPLNKYISSILRIANVADLADSRFFWRGDVFVVKFKDMTATGGTYVSLPADVEMDRIIQGYLRQVWEVKDLEKLLQSVQDMEESSEKSRRE